MYIVLHCLTSSLCRSLEQRSHIHVEAAVGISGSYHLCTTVMTVLTHLRHEDTRTATFLLGKLFCQRTGFLEV